MSALLHLLTLLPLLSGLAMSYPLSKRDLFLPIPHRDQFYNAPNNLESLKEGEIYRQRRIFPQLEYATAKEVVQVAYRTTATGGNASHTVATVFTPQHPDKDAKIFSYQFWEDSDNIDCSPSYSLWGGLLTPDGVTATLDTAIFINWAMANGYYVVVPDHEGPNSAFFAGFTEGYAGLDGIRAAINHLELGADTAVALYGYSGGAHATVWMTNLADRYAPELNIVGAAHGGTPIDPKETMKFLDGQLFSGFVLGAVGGLAHAYPELLTELWPYAKQSLRDGLNTIWSNNNCILTEVIGYAHLNFAEMTTLSDFYTYPPIVGVFQGESLLSNYSSNEVGVPKFPRYIYHADKDEIIPSNIVRQYVSQQCESGANIQFVDWPGGDHVSMEIFGIPNALQFLQQAFEGKTPQVACGTQAQDFLTVSTEGVGSIIGEGVLAAVKLLDGLTTPFGKINLNL